MVKNIYYQTPDFYRGFFVLRSGSYKVVTEMENIWEQNYYTIRDLPQGQHGLSDIWGHSYYGAPKYFSEPKHGLSLT